MANSVQRSKFRAFAAMGRYFRILLRHSLPGLVLVMLALIAALAGLFGVLWVIADIFWKEGQGEAPPNWIFYVWLLAALWLGCASASPLAAHAAAREQDGHRAGFRDSWSVLWRHLPISLVVMGIQAAMVGVGTMVLIIPGLIANVVVSLAVPARVVEDVGPLKAIARSIDLSEGVRWRLFGFVCMSGTLLVLAAIGGLAIVAAAGGAMGASGLTDEASPTPFYIALNIAFALGLLLIISLVAWLSALGPAAAFAQIRAGMSARAAADVFD